jgi:hypothetical protein
MSNNNARLAAVDNSRERVTGSELNRTKDACAEIRRMRISAQRELQLARQARIEAERYLREIETSLRSQAQMIVLSARMATKKRIAEVSRETRQEMQKVLADRRLVKNTAQKELEAQQKFTNAARIKALSMMFPEKSEQ